MKCPECNNGISGYEDVPLDSEGDISVPITCKPCRGTGELPDVQLSPGICSVNDAELRRKEAIRDVLAGNTGGHTLTFETWDEFEAWLHSITDRTEQEEP